MLLIRSFKQNDLSDILSLRRDTISYVNSKDYSPLQISSWIGQNEDERRLGVLLSSYSLVAVIDEEIVGYANLFIEQAYLDQLYVHKDFQGQHIAQALLLALEEKAKEEALKEIQVESSITAKGFFLKHGFNIVLEQEKPITTDISVKNYVMSKSLA